MRLDAAGAHRSHTTPPVVALVRADGLGGDAPANDLAELGLPLCDG